MPQVVAAAAAIGSALATKTATQLFLGAVSMLMGFAGNMQQAHAARKAARKRANTETGGGHLVSVRDTQGVLPVVYGQMKLGGNQVYVHVSGSNNKYIHLVQTFCEGEVDSLVGLYLDDKPVADYGSYVYYEFFTGSDDQNVCATLQGVDSNWADPLRGTCYAYVRLEYSEAKFNSLPSISAEIKGRKVYDTQTATTVWSNNAALCIYDYMRNPRFGGGVAASFFTEANITDVKTWCTSQGYTMNALIVDQAAFGDHVKSLLDGFRSDIVWDGDTFQIIPLDEDAPVMTLTEDDIVADTWDFGAPSLFRKHNAVNLKFVDKDNKWVMVDRLFTDETAVTADGEIRPLELHLLGVNDYTQATKMVSYHLDRLRLDREHTFTAGRKAFALSPGDRISVTHHKPGWAAEIVRVVKMTITSMTHVQLTVQEEDPLLYDDIVNVASHDLYTTTLPDPLAAPPSVANVSITEEQVTVKDNTHARVKITWTAAANYPFLDYADVWVSRDAEATYQYATPGELSATLEPLKDGDELWIKILAVSIQGIKQKLADVNAYHYTVTGKDTVPDDITGFQVSAAGDNVHLRWEPFSDLTDILLYEVRYGASFGSSLFFTHTKAVNVDRPGVKPGTHTFCIKAMDSLRNYSANAAVSTVIVGNPIGYASDTSFGPNNYGTGTHNNTEQYNDPTYGYVLRVTHGGGLSGDYTSPQYDLGSSIKTDRLWSVFETVIQATGATWQGGVGSVQWDSVLAAGETWIQQFANVQAGILKMDLLYSENGSDWYTLTGFELLSMEVTARYLKYKIYITDNDTNSYIYLKPTTLQAWARA